MSDIPGKGILLECGTNEVEFLLFRLGRQAYGINVAKVFQIVLFDPASVAALPQQAPGILGVMDLRGETITVVDLKSYLGFPPTAEAEVNRRLLLIAEFNKARTAFVVDSVDRIERCSWSNFEPIKNRSGGLSASNVVGTVTLETEIVILVDVETIMGTLNPSMSVEYYEKDIKSSSAYDRSKIAIVTCEDSTVVQKVLIRTLTNAGFTNIRAFSTGAEGLEYLKERGNPADIILTDIEMPQMDGLTLCKKVRAFEHRKGAPVIFFSSMINDQMRKKCELVGGNACFSKPEIHLLVDAIDAAAGAPSHQVAR